MKWFFEWAQDVLALVVMMMVVAATVLASAGIATVVLDWRLGQ